MKRNKLEVVTNTIRYGLKSRSVMSMDKPRGVETHRFVVRELHAGEPQPTVKLISYNYGQSFCVERSNRDIVYYNLRTPVVPSDFPIQELMAIAHHRYLEIVQKRELA